MSMMKLHNRFAWAGLCLLMGYISHAQQLPQYTMFMNGKLLYNPGYAGTSGGINATALGRWQWVGFKGAPNTQSLAVDAGLPNKKIGIGASFTRDEVAITSFTNFTLNYAYHLSVWGGKLSMGLSGSINRAQISYSDVYVPDPDANFTQRATSSKLNFGTGLYYDRPDFWISVSLPEILNSKFNKNGDAFYNQSRHFFLAGGYRYQVNPKLRLEPSVQMKAVQGSSVGLDFNLMAWLNNRVGGGLGYRPSESVNMIVQLKVTERLSVGYAFDYVINDNLSQVSNTSHEIMVSFKMPWKNNAASDKKQETEMVPYRN
jgi:type IX secretion system PorP/SprF family membrane protein